MPRKQRPKVPIEPSTGKEWSVGEVARLTSSTLRAIRFYEQEGLLSVKERTTGRHRRYSAEEFDQLRAIVELRRAGLSIDEIRRVIEVRRQPLTGAAVAGNLMQMLDEQIVTINERILQLRRVQSDLGQLRESLAACHDCTRVDTSAKTCNDCQKFSTNSAENTMMRVLWRHSR